MDTSLNGRTALITGGSKGIGRAIAEAYYQAGARVAVVARSVSALNAAVAEIAQLESPDAAQIEGFRPRPVLLALALGPCQTFGRYPLQRLEFPHDPHRP